MYIHIEREREIRKQDTPMFQQQQRRSRQKVGMSIPPLALPVNEEATGAAATVGATAAAIRSKFGMPPPSLMSDLSEQTCSFSSVLSPLPLRLRPVVRRPQAPPKLQQQIRRDASASATDALHPAAQRNGKMREFMLPRRPSTADCGRRAGKQGLSSPPHARVRQQVLSQKHSQQVSLLEGATHAPFFHFDAIEHVVRSPTNLGLPQEQQQQQQQQQSVPGSPSMEPLRSRQESPDPSGDNRIGDRSLSVLSGGESALVRSRKTADDGFLNGRGGSSVAVAPTALEEEEEEPGMDSSLNRSLMELAQSSANPILGPFHKVPSQSSTTIPNTSSASDDDAYSRSQRQRRILWRAASLRCIATVVHLLLFLTSFSLWIWMKSHSNAPKQLLFLMDTDVKPFSFTGVAFGLHFSGMVVAIAYGLAYPLPYCLRQQSFICLLPLRWQKFWIRRQRRRSGEVQLTTAALEEVGGPAAAVATAEENGPSSTPGTMPRSGEDTTAVLTSLDAAMVNSLSTASITIHGDIYSTTQASGTPPPPPPPPVTFPDTTDAEIENKNVNTASASAPAARPSTKSSRSPHCLQFSPVCLERLALVLRIVYVLCVFVSMYVVCQLCFYVLLRILTSFPNIWDWGTMVSMSIPPVTSEPSSSTGLPREQQKALDLICDGIQLQSRCSGFRTLCRGPFFDVKHAYSYMCPFCPAEVQEQINRVAGNTTCSERFSMVRLENAQMYLALLIWGLVVSLVSMVTVAISRTYNAWSTVEEFHE